MELETTIEDMQIQNAIQDKTDDPMTQEFNNYQKRLTCSRCNKTFTQVVKLNIHEMIHTGKIPFSCSKCNKKFTTSSNLKTHERIHTDEKPFSCSKCDKKFSQAGYLKTHERIHTDEKPSSGQSVTTNATNQVH